jgi:hypothetical protein
MDAVQSGGRFSDVSEERTAFNIQPIACSLLLDLLIDPRT